MLDFTKENIFIKRLSVATKDKFTFDFNDKAYYFKTCANMGQKEMSRSILNEVLISHIARKCGMNCVESHLAKVNKDGKTLLGVLTPSFCEEGFDRASLQVFLKPYFLKQRQEAQSEDEKKILVTKNG